MLGDLARSRSTTSRRFGPSSVVVKLPTEADVNRKRGMLFGFYEREANFYRNIGNQGRTGGLRVPSCYASPMDPAGERFALVPRTCRVGFRMPDQVVGLRLDDARMAIRALGQFHANLVGHRRLRALEPWLPAHERTDHQTGRSPIVPTAWPLFVERFDDLIPDGVAPIGESVGPIFEQLLDDSAAVPRTIVHTDFRLDNLFFDGPDA